MKTPVVNKLIYTLLFIAASMILYSCSRNPVSGKKEFMLMSLNQELALGKQSDPQILQSFGVYPDSKIQKFINDKGQQMARISHRRDLKYEFKVLDSPVINAFAVPGGYVYFTRGILAHFNNEAEFAGVLGHEIGHVTARHSARQYSKNMVAQVGFIAGMIASPYFRQYAQEASTAMQLLFLKFGRDAETESDKLGVEYSSRIGYDAVHMANFFKTLKRMRVKSGQTIPTFMSTHPDPGDRYNNVKTMAEAYQGRQTQGQQFKVNRDEYLRLIDGIVYGEDPRQGYVESNVFYHPTLKFKMNVPSGWQHVNSPTQFQMGPKDGKAMMMLTMAKETTVQAARDNFVKNYQLKIVSQPTPKLDGLNAIGIVAEQVPQQQTQQQTQQQQQEPIRIMSYFIEHGGKIYIYLGVTSQDQWTAYQGLFSNTLDKFGKLTDPTKLNVKPERVNVVSAQSNTTLSNILKQNGVETKRLEEIAILNSMELTQTIKQGTLIKVLEKR